MVHAFVQKWDAWNPLWTYANHVRIKVRKDGKSRYVQGFNSGKRQTAALACIWEMGSYPPEIMWSAHEPPQLWLTTVVCM